MRGLRVTGPARRRRGDAAAALLLRLRGTGGFGLVELLIALLVLNVGILAMVAAFNSGAIALRKASQTSTAASIAEKEMEYLRGISYADIPLGTATRVDPGPDGREYRIDTEIVERTETPTSGPVEFAAREVKVVTVEVVDVATGRTVIRTQSTFDEALGA